MTENHDNEGFGGVARSRRSFIKKFAAGAFIAPVIASFALDGMASASVAPNLPNQNFPNQSCANQELYAELPFQSPNLVLCGRNS